LNDAIGIAEAPELANTTVAAAASNDRRIMHMF
jgi:hypothetical protein